MKKGNETSIKTALAKYNGGNVAWQSNGAQGYANDVYSTGKQYELGVSSPISVAPGDLTYPTTGRITSPYGWRDIGNGQEFHYGVDIGAGGRKKCSYCNSSRWCSFICWPIRHLWKYCKGSARNKR
ncbi:hypothetical protein OL548_34750 (plasmid) [Lysinibacillus sp. MHQ-1]|nr:hypothetical protein OL548_34750 [Lysinibacillus sp. MHQ-1]